MQKTKLLIYINHQKPNNNIYIKKNKLMCISQNKNIIKNERERVNSSMTIEIIKENSIRF